MNAGANDGIRGVNHVYRRACCSCDGVAHEFFLPMRDDEQGVYNGLDIWHPCVVLSSIPGTGRANNDTKLLLAYRFFMDSQCILLLSPN